METSSAPIGGAVTTAAAVANCFLDLAAAEPAVPPTDQMKIQKLVFYAHAWHLAFNNRPLFEEDIEAWPWGPIVRNLYLDFKGYGRNPITGRATIPRQVGPDPWDVRMLPPDVEEPAIREFIRSVWDTHKGFTGIQLSNATHEPGEPWTVIRNAYGSLDGKPTIPNELILKIFRRKLDEPQEDAAA